MERQEIIRDVHKQIENLARLHVQYGLYHTDGFRAHKEQIRQRTDQTNDPREQS